MLWLLWGLAIGGVLANWLPVNALTVPDGVAKPRYWQAVEPVPELLDAVRLSRNLEKSLAASDVVSGRWQPQPAPRGVEDVVSPDGASTQSETTVVTEVETSRVASVATRDTRRTDAPDVPSAAENVGSEPAESAAGATSATLADVPAAADTSAHSAHATPGESGSVARLVTTPRPATVVDPLAPLKESARAAISRNKPQHAYSLLWSRVGYGRDDVEYLALMAVAAIADQRFAEAEVVYSRLTALDAHDARWWAGLALSREQLGQDASAAYRRLASLAEAGTRLHVLAVERLESRA